MRCTRPIAPALLGFVLALAAVPGVAAPPPTAAPEAIHRFDLARHFFASPEDEAAARTGVDAAIAELDRRAAGATTPAGLVAALEADDRAQRMFRRHDLYLFLRFAIDTHQADGLAAADAMRNRLRAARAHLARVALAHGAAWFADDGTGDPALARYRHWYAQARRQAEHALSPDAQQAVDALGPLVDGSTYPARVRDLRFAPVRVDGKALDPRRDQSALDTHVDAAVRRAGSRQLMAGYATQREPLAELLVRVVRGRNAIARLRGHEDALDAAAFEAVVTPARYRALLADVAVHAPVFKDWQRRVSDPFARPAHWTPAQAAALVTRSASAVAPAYAAEFAALLDPAQGRVDLGGDGPRVPIQGAASVYPIGVSTIYMQQYTGDLLDLVVLGHEAGHAVQAQLMHRAGVPMLYAAGPGYFTESFGRFQELLLLEYLHRDAADPQRRAWLRDALAARLLSVFNSAEEAAIELALHDAVRGGQATGADDLDRATAAASARYTRRIEDAPEMRGMWMLSEGYFQTPLQELNDAYASLLAVRYYQRYRQDPARFGPAYMALLAGGYDDTPRALLQRHLGIDMEASDFVPGTLSALDAEVARLYR